MFPVNFKIPENNWESEGRVVAFWKEQ